VVFGCSFLLTAAGQSRIFTGFPLDVPWKRRQQAPHNIKRRSPPVNLNVAVFSFLLQCDPVIGDVAIELGLARTDVVEGFCPVEAVLAA
jgi:hypothetical protein